MKKIVVLLALFSASVWAVEPAELEAACTRWADSEAVDAEHRPAYMNECLTGLQQELEQTGEVDLDW